MVPINFKVCVKYVVSVKQNKVKHNKTKYARNLINWLPCVE